MRKKYLYLAISVLFFFGNTTFAGKLSLEIENDHYSTPTKLEGLIAWEGKEKTKTFAILIPSTGSFTSSIVIEPASITCITLALYNGEEIEHENQEGTLLASTLFNPKKEMMKSLKISLVERKLNVSATY